MVVGSHYEPYDIRRVNAVCRGRPAFGRSFVFDNRNNDGNGQHQTSFLRSFDARTLQRGKAKPYLIFSLTDETFSLVCSPWLPDNIDRKKYFLTLSALNQSYWIIGSTLGALIGTALPFDTTGVDFSMTALFVIIFVEQWEKANNHLPAITGVAVTSLCLLIFGSENFLIPSMIAIAVLLFAEKRFIIREEKKDAVE